MKQMNLTILWFAIITVSFTDIVHSATSAGRNDDNAFEKYKKQLPGKSHINRTDYECDDKTIPDLMKYIKDGEKLIKGERPDKNIFVVIGEKNSDKTALANILVEVDEPWDIKLEEDISIYPREAGHYLDMDDYLVIEAADLKSVSVAGQAAGAYFLNEMVKGASKIKLIFAYNYLGEIYPVWEYLKHISENNPEIGMFQLRENDCFIRTNISVGGSFNFDQLVEQAKITGFGNHQGLLKTEKEFSDKNKRHIFEITAYGHGFHQVKLPMYGDYESCIKDKVEQQLIQDLKNSTENLLKHFQSIAKDSSMPAADKIEFFNEASESITDILNTLSEDMNADGLTIPLAAYLKKFKFDKDAETVSKIPDYIKVIKLFRPDLKTPAWSKGLEPIYTYVTDYYEETQAQAVTDLNLFTCDDPQHNEIVNQVLYEVKFELSVEPNGTGEGWRHLLRELGDLTGENILTIFKTMGVKARQEFLEQLQEKLKNYDGDSCDKKIQDFPVEEPDDCDEDGTDEAMGYFQGGTKDVVTESRENVLVVLGTENSGQLQAANLLANFDIKSPATLDPLVYPDFLSDPLNSSYSVYSGPQYNKEKTTPQGAVSKYFLHRVLANTNAKIIVTFSEESLAEGGDEEFQFIMGELVKVIVGFTDFTKCVGFVISDVEAEKIEESQIEIADKLIKALKSLSEESEEHMKTIIDMFLAEKDQIKMKIGILRKAGKLGKAKSFKENRDHLLQVVENGLIFNKYGREDITTMLSEGEAKIMHCLQWDVRSGMIENITKILEPLEEFCKSLEEGKYLNHQARYKEFDYANKVILLLLNNLTISYQVKDIFNPLVDLMAGLRLSVSEVKIRHVQEDAILLRSHGHTYTDVFEEGFKTIKNYVIESRRWYYFLIKIDVWMSEYSVIKDRAKYESPGQKLLAEIKTDAAEKQNILQFIDTIEGIPKEPLKTLLGNIEPNLIKLDYLGTIISKLFTKQLDVDCTDEINVCKGAHVTVSECLNQRCLPKKPIEIQASHKVYIDVDIKEKGNENYVAILAPEWQIIGDRVIEVDGIDGVLEDAPKADDGEKAMVPGVVGKPGLPGGPAGHFLGVGEKFSPGGTLRISAEGGKGSRGQDGGNGGPAKDPETPPMKWDVKSSVNFYQYGYRTTRHHCSNSEYCFYTLVKSTGNGAPGGDGGKGGEGGFAGKITMVSLKGKTFNVTQEIRKGVDGPGGQGGLAGNKRTGTFQVTEEYVNWKFKAGTYRYAINEERDIRIVNSGSSGQNGESNKNAEKIKTSQPLKKPPNLAITLNRYNVYLRESSVKSSTASRVLHEIGTNKELNSLYDAASLADAYTRLETQSQRLKKKILVVPFYEILFQQITNFSEAVQINDEEKKVLSFLCTAALSKLAAERKRDTPLVVELTNYLKDVIVNIKDLNSLESEKLVQSYKEDYQKKVDDSIQETQKLIDQEIKPMVDGLQTKMNKQMEALIKEVLEKKKQNKAEKKTLLAKKKELEKSLVWRKIMSVVGVATSMLSFLGPTAGAIGGALNAGVRMTQSLAMSNSPQEASAALMTVPLAVNTQLASITTALEEKKSTFNDNLVELEKRLAGMKEKGAEKEVAAIQDKVKSTKDQLGKVDIKNIDPKAAQKIETLRAGLNKELAEKKSAVQEAAAADAKIDKQVERIGQLQNVVNVGESVAQAYNAFKSNDAAIDEVNQQLQANAETMKKLETYETSIYSQMLPMCRGIQDRVSSLSSDNEGKSHSALDVEQWKVTEHLLDMKGAMKKMTEGFDMSEEMQSVMTKIERGTEVMMKLFHRIQDSKDKSELAAFLADINSSQASAIKVKDPLLKKVIADVQISIKANLILEAYEAGFKSFLQSFFPFGTRILGTYEIPEKLRGNSTDRMVKFAEERIIKMMNEVSASKTTITKQDANIYRNAQFRPGDADDELVPPFYIWRYEDNKAAISKLFEGQTVEFNADIRKLHGENNYRKAVKFTNLRLAFVPREKKKKETIDETLKNIYISLQSLGTFYYKCGDKYFDMSNEQFEIRYTHRLDEDGKEPINSNDVYQKIKENTAMFSPYGKWNITLQNRNAKAVLKPMKKIKMDLQFYGKGFYVGEESDVCKENLDLIYSRDGVDPTKVNPDNDFLTQLREL